jgi:hypothetical protein
MKAASEVAHYLFNEVAKSDVRGSTLPERVAGRLDIGMWGVGSDEPHRGALAPGDLVLIYLGAPERVFVGRAVLASPFRRWTPEEARRYPGDAEGGVLLTQIERWDPPVPMYTVLAVMDPSQKARADFEFGVVAITATEYQTALSVAAGPPETPDPDSTARRGGSPHERDMGG